MPAVKHGLVSRRCGADGQWVMVNGSQPWRDYSQCEEELEDGAEEVGARVGWGHPKVRGGQRVLKSQGSPAGRRPQADGELQSAVHRGLRTVTPHPHLRSARPHRLQVGAGLRAIACPGCS